ncbi:MAG TPA: hypothetical protein VIK91_16635, partial [Nannocystis sp.]
LDTRGPDTENLYSIPGFTLEEFEKILGEHGGLGSLPGAIRAMWTEPGDLDFSPLATVGINLSEKPVQPGAVDPGFTTQDRNGALWVEAVRAGTPAEQAGLAPGDELLALRAAEGPWLRFRPSRAARVWEHLRPGTPAELLVSRRERVLTLPLTFLPARGAPVLERAATADPAARAQFEAWSKRGWSDP